MRKTGPLFTIKKYLLAVFVFLGLFLMSNPASFSAPDAITVKDDAGRTVTLKRPAVRIVSLSSAHAENLVALRAVKQLAGVSFFADPKWIPAKIPRLSRTPLLSQIKERKPDLVIMDKALTQEHRALIKDMENAAIPIAVFDRPGLGSFAAYLKKLGQLAGRDKDADRLMESFGKTLLKSDVRPSGAEKPSVLIIAGADFSVSAPDSWASGIVRAFHGRLFLEKGGVPTSDFPWYVFFGPKRAVSEGKGIDVIITLSDTGRSVPSMTRDEVMKDPTLKNISAVKSGRVWEMKASDMMLPSMVRLDYSLKLCWKLLRAEGRPLKSKP